MTMKKKLFTIALALCMILTMVPGGVSHSEVGWAAENEGQTSTEPEVNVQSGSPHTHCVCAKGAESSEHTHDATTKWAEWTSTDSLPDKAGNYYLKANVELNDAWQPVGGTVLCLNGKSVTANGNFNTIEVQGSSTFTLTDCEPNGTMGEITHASDKIGSGVKVQENAVFDMYGGNITGNTAKSAGGGVYVTKGTFTMSGGSISDNIATGTPGNGTYGGGVHNSGGIFTMNDGTISGNSATHGGGVYSAVSGSAFHMLGGNITGNTASTYGGGVYTSEGPFTMTAGTIAENKTTKSQYGRGGGVYNGSNTFTMSGGAITNNTSAYEGGGVYNSGTFTMKDNAAISQNMATNRGGGVINWDIFNLSGGTITNNTAAEGGGMYNAYISGNPGRPTTTLSGAPRITGNGNGSTECNLSIYSSQWPVTATELTADARIGITAPIDDTGILVKGSTDTNVFFSDISGYKLVADGNSGLKLEEDTSASATEHKNHCVCVGNAAGGDHQHNYAVEWKAWEDNNSLPDKAGNYYLKANVELNDAWQPAGGTVLCLNGHSIICNAGTADSAIPTIRISSGTFTLTDCSKDAGGSNTGKVTHGTNCIGRGVQNYGTFYLYGGNITGNRHKNKVTFNGAGVMNDNGATFIMYGGSITKNEDESGSGVYNAAQGSTKKRTIFTMYGGTISENSANNQGGGVCNQCDFTMYGGTISGNSAVEGGGGVYNTGGAGYGGAFTMYGGTIAGNTSASRGGGVYVYGYSTNYRTLFNLYGGSITGNNTTDNGGGVYMSSGGTMTVGGSSSIAGNVKGGTWDSEIGGISGGSPNNVYLPYGTVIAISDSDNKLTGPIGISPAKAPSSTENIIIANDALEGKDYSEIFKSDNTDYKIVRDDKKKGRLILTLNSSEHQHTWSDWKHNDSQHWKVCANCDETSERADHSWDGGVITKPATTEADGVKTYTCSVCKVTRTETIAKLGHEHIYANEWTYDATDHWHACTVEGCKETQDKAKHTSPNGVCNVCGYKNSNNSSSSGGGYVAPSTDVKTTGNTDSKVTSSPSAVQNETRTDASGKQETVAKVTVSAANQREILSQAKTNKSKSIVIEVTKTAVKDGAKVELNLDKAFVQSILNDTEASLTIQTADGTKVISREELKTLVEKAEGTTVTVDPAEAEQAQPEQPADTLTPAQEKIVKGVENTNIDLRSQRTPGGNILLTWAKEKGYKVDYFEIYRSTKRSGGYGRKPFFRTPNGNWTKYLNTKNIKEGSTYYYKIRGVRIIDGKKYYTEYSTKAWRSVK